MILATDFETFLHDIRPTKSMREDLKTGHKTLRNRLNADDNLKELLVSDFLQGSYRRYTAVRPKGNKRSDVDIIVVTKLDEADCTAAEAMEVFVPFLDKYYKGKWRRQGRSFGIEMTYVELDLVITSAPSESEVGMLKSDAVTTSENIVEARDWRLNANWLSPENRHRADAQELLAKSASQAEWQGQPLRIPDRDADKWDDTDPLEQIRWTSEKNSECSGCFVNVVKCLKWWRLENYDAPKHPKGFPLERLIGEHCPSSITSVAEGIVCTLEAIVSAHAITIATNAKPYLPDYGVPAHDVFGRITVDDFATFYDQVKEGAALARRAFNENEDRTESGNLWRELLGTKFPAPPSGGGEKKAGFTNPTKSAVPGSGRFA